MPTVQLAWETTFGARHAIVRTPQGRNALCDFKGNADAPHLPCEACRQALWRMTASALPLPARAAAPTPAGVDR